MHLPDDRARRLLNTLLGPFRAYCLYAAGGPVRPGRFETSPSVTPSSSIHHFANIVSSIRSGNQSFPEVFGAPLFDHVITTVRDARATTTGAAS